MNDEYVLIFALGPVQSFIAEARRTKDLFAGSKILAELARSAAEAIREANGRLVFPAEEVLENEMEGLPNKLVAIVSDPHQAAEKAKARSIAKWHDFAETARKNLVDINDDEFVRIWRRQRDDHLEFYWAAALIKEDYISSHKEANEAFEARKRTRTFLQIEEDGLKDTLSGKRTALRSAANKNAGVYWQRLLKSKEARTNLKLGERLDTIGAIKRFSLEEKFPSVSTVASVPFVELCRSTGLLDEFVQAIEAYNRQAGYEYFYKVGNFGRGFSYDGDLLYEETYSPRRLKSSYGQGSPPEEVVSALKQLYTSIKIKKKHPSRPCPYYTVLMMDGDLMGDHISQCRNWEEHKEFSARLAEFAETAPGIVNSMGGYLVYAGGDDVVALLPLAISMSAASALREAYRDIFSDWQGKYPHHQSALTVSCGIAVAHHLYPFDAALEEARVAEKTAKNIYGRDSLCVSVLKRSGEHTLAESKWEHAGISIGRHIELLSADFLEERLSSRFAGEFGRQVAELGNVESNLVVPLLTRLFGRHSKKTGKFPETGISELTAWLRSFEDTGIELQGGSAGELARWLLLARFMAQGGDE